MRPPIHRVADKSRNISGLRNPRRRDLGAQSQNGSGVTVTGSFYVALLYGELAMTNYANYTC